MKTIENLREIIAENRNDYFAFRDRKISNVRMLESIYADTLGGGKPSDVIGTFVDSVGLQEAVETVATLVNRHSWDGRISHWVKSWAENQPNAWDEESAKKMYICTDRIHMVHLNQLAEEIMKISQ